jgi:ferredoxin
MIIAEQKPIEEILGYLKGFRNILIAACGTCVTVCLSGGEKEALLLASLLEVKAKEENRDLTVKVITPKRQCDMEFLEETVREAEKADVVISMACGAGIQYLSEHIKGKPVLPAVNTRFIGVAREAGLWTEMCQGCGDCILEKTGGICPVTRCSKSNLNGPCGGSSGGKCEIDPETDCGWQLIYDRLKESGKLDRLNDIIEPKDWTTSRDGGPRKQEKKDIRI